MEKALVGTAGHSHSASWPRCPQCSSPPGPHSSAASRSDLRVPCWRCCGWKEQGGGPQYKLLASSLPGWPTPGPKQDLPTQPDFQELAYPHRIKPLTSQTVCGAGVPDLTLSIGFKASIWLCCQSTNLLFMFFFFLELASLYWQLPLLTQAIRIGTETYVRGTQQFLWHLAN